MSRFPLRKKIRLPLPVYNQNHVYFVTVATYQKHKWFSIHYKLCETAVQIIRKSAIELEIKLFAWCLMPDHIHLLVHGSKLIEYIRWLKGKMTPFARKFEKDRHLWQRSFYDHALRKEEALLDVACYIWENPVRAKLVDDPCKYSWSGSEIWPDWRDKYGRG